MTTLVDRITVIEQTLATLQAPASNQVIINQLAAISKELGLPFSANQPALPTRQIPLATDDLGLKDIPDSECVIIYDREDQTYIDGFSIDDTSKTWCRADAGEITAVYFKKFLDIVFIPAVTGRFVVYGSRSGKKYGWFNIVDII